MPEDIVIIGGSAAGFYTAYQLAKKGLEVRVFEAKHALDPSPRTLIVTRYLSGLIGPLCEDSEVNRIRNYELYADGRFANVSLQHPDVVIERSTLIRSLAERAEERGVKIHTDRRFMSLKPNGRRLTFIVSPNGESTQVEESADVLIGADGAFSRVAQSAGWPQQPTAPLVQAIVRLPDDIPPDTTRIWFVPKDTPYFYWLIPYSSTHGVLGLIGEEQRKTRKALEDFLKTKALEPLEFQTACIPRYRNWIPFRRTIEGSNVYLVGDAAGHVKVTTVGGLVTGFRGARGVVDAITNGGSSRRSNALRLELDLHLLVRRVLNHFGEKDYAKLLGLLTPPVKRSLSLFNRDESTKLLTHVFLKQPRLLLLGLRSLLLGK